VKLIDTDGLVFIGTGSEWFWTALSGLILVVTFLAIYRQLRLQANASAIEDLEDFDRVANSERFNRYAIDIFVALRDGIDRANVPEAPGVLAADLPADLPDAAYEYVAAALERFATLYRSGHRDLKLLARHNTEGAQSWWTALAPSIRAARASSGRPGECENLEWLARYMGEVDRRAGVPAITSGTIARNIDTWIARSQERIRVEQALRTVILMSPEPVTVAPSLAPAAPSGPATTEAPQAAPS